MNLLKETKQLFAENEKTLMNENKDNISSWRDIPCSWIVRISTVKITILSKAIYEKMEYLSSYSMIFFTELEQ